MQEQNQDVQPALFYKILMSQSMIIAANIVYCYVITIIHLEARAFWPGDQACK